MKPRKIIRPSQEPKMVFTLLRPTDLVQPGDWHNYSGNGLDLGWQKIEDDATWYFGKPVNAYVDWNVARPIPHLCNLPDYCYA